MITEIYIGTDSLDLYEDENIVITSSVANIQDIDKIFTDYGRNINVPASHKNNKILQHWYNSSVVDGFDNRITKSGKISLGGGDFRYGKFKIDNVTMKNGKAVNYSLSFIGNLIELKERFGDDKLSDLDTSSLDFEYTSDNVKLFLEGTFGITNSIVASTFSSKRFIYNSTSNENENENTSNIANIAGSNGINWLDVKFSVRLGYLLSVISNDYNISFNGLGLKSNEIWNMFLLLDANKDIYLFKSEVDIVSTDDPGCDLTENTFFTYEQGEEYTSLLRIRVDTVEDDIEYNVVCENENEEIASFKGVNFNEFVLSNLSKDLPVKIYIRSKEPVNYYVDVYRDVSFGGQPITRYFSNNSNSDINNSFYKISENIPDIKVFDFLQGIIKYFKLVIIPNDEGGFDCETLNDFYKKGNLIKDISKIIDVSSMNISNYNRYKSLKYTYEEPSTILNIEYSERNNKGYGDFTKEITTGSGVSVDGDDFNFNIPFEQVIYERIYDIKGVDSLNFQYGLIANKELSPVSTKGHLHYVNVLDTDSNIKFKGQSTEETINTLVIPSRSINEQYSNTVGVEFDEYTGQLINNTIYNNYHKSFIEKISNVQTRYFKMTAKNIPSHILNNIKLNDVIEWNGVFYRIDKMEINITKRSILFYLFNDINLEIDYTVPVTWDRTDITWDNTVITFDKT